MNELSDRCFPGVCSPPLMATQMSRYVLRARPFVFGRRGARIVIKGPGRTRSWWAEGGPSWS